jgi:hypothetical protein
MAASNRRLPMSQPTRSGRYTDYDAASLTSVGESRFVGKVAGLGGRE